MLTYVVAVLCVIGLAVGQILFKLSAIAVTKNGSFISTKPALILLSAMSLYAVASIAWVWVLQRTELGRIYPLMALAFILVPIGSYIFLGERFQPLYFVGVAMIIAGICVVLQK